jgi:hypothetical protein
MFAFTTTAQADIVFQENFDGNGPGFSNWTITDGGDTGDTWDGYPGGWNYSGGTGNCAAADANLYYSEYNDKLSYTIDINGYTGLQMTLNVGYWEGDYGDSNAVGYILGYVDGAAVSTTIDFFSQDWPDGDSQPYDLSFADGASTLDLTFQFVSDYDGWFMVDNIEITGNPVPVPAAVWLLGSGIVSLAALRRRSASLFC